MREDGTAFTDVMVHWWLRQNGFENVGGEWFRCTVGDVRAAMYALKSGTENEEHRTETFKMRFGKTFTAYQCPWRCSGSKAGVQGFPVSLV